MWSLPILLLVALSFFPSLIILTFIFAAILAGGSVKRTFYRRAFVIAFSGLAVAAAFALVAPFLPNFIPFMDIGIAFAFITWVLLVRRYHGTGWLESLPPAAIAAILYVVMMAIASGFSILLLQDQTEVWMLSKILV
ncbi:MAG: hypothetical protein JSV05_03910 [Candidatus Bathyarchaeota archaeon]|nr:MAG: hypothetical protein JSV05_03910 [Candidatus Bathyarchaeota archaeon]